MSDFIFETVCYANFSNRRLDIANRRKYGEHSEDQTYHSILTDLKRQGCQTLHQVEVTSGWVCYDLGKNFEAVAVASAFVSQVILMSGENAPY